MERRRSSSNSWVKSPSRAWIAVRNRFALTGNSLSTRWKSERETLRTLEGSRASAVAGRSVWLISAISPISAFGPTI